MHLMIVIDTIKTSPYTRICECAQWKNDVSFKATAINCKTKLLFFKR